MHSPAATPTSNLLFRYQSPSSRSPSASPRRAVFTDSEYVAKRIAVAAKDVEIRTLREGYQPGDLKFDPLGMMPKDGAGMLAMQEKELRNGRLAMIAIAGMTVQELVTGQQAF